MHKPCLIMAVINLLFFKRYDSSFEFKRFCELQNTNYTLVHAQCIIMTDTEPQ